jgi:hypothetical protein
VLLPEDGGRPLKHLGGKIVYFLYILCTWKVLPFEVFCGLSLVPTAKFRNNTVPQTDHEHFLPYPSLFTSHTPLHNLHNSTQLKKNVKFEVLTAMLLKIQAFWDVTLYHWASSSKHFERP